MIVQLTQITEHVTQVMQESTRNVVLSVLESLKRVVPGFELNAGRIAEITNPPPAQPDARIVETGWHMSPFYNNYGYKAICSYNGVPMLMKCSWVGSYMFSYPRIHYTKLMVNFTRWPRPGQDVNIPAVFKGYMCYVDEAEWLKNSKPPTLAEFQLCRSLVRQCVVSSATAANINVRRPGLVAADSEVQRIESVREEFAKSYKRYMAKVTKQKKEENKAECWARIHASYIKDRFTNMLADYNRFTKTQKKAALAPENIDDDQVQDQ